MTCDIVPRSPDGPLYRIGRAPDPWTWPDWRYAGRDGTFGNRWDDPDGEYRVLCAASERLGAFVEVLARFRPDPAVVAGCAEIEGDEGDEESIPPGRLPHAWVNNRLMGQGTMSGDFADVGDAGSLSFLRHRLLGRLLHYGLDDLDAATIRLSTPRAFTQEVSRLVYECSTGAAAPQFCGICYRSRLGDQFESWAIFERLATHPVTRVASDGIDRADPDLLQAIALLRLELAP